MRSAIEFVGRQTAAAAVGASARELLHAVDAGAALLEEDMPRRNVHCIYGQSGIGKSESYATSGTGWKATRQLRHTGERRLLLAEAG